MVCCVLSLVWEMKAYLKEAGCQQAAKECIQCWMASCGRRRHQRLSLSAETVPYMTAGSPQLKSETDNFWCFGKDLCLPRQRESQQLLSELIKELSETVEQQLMGLSGSDLDYPWVGVQAVIRACDPVVGMPASSLLDLGFLGGCTSPLSFHFTESSTFCMRLC